MSVSNKQFNLIISAQNNAHQTFKEMQDDYTRLTQQALEQVEAAKKGLSTVEETNVAIKKLKESQENLRGRNSLVAEWEKINALIDSANAKAEAKQSERNAYTASASQFNKNGSESKTYIKKVRGYDDAIANAEGLVARRTADLAAFEKSLADAGVEIKSFVGQDDAVKRFIAEMGKSLVSVTQAAQEVPKAVREAKEALKAQADAEKDAAAKESELRELVTEETRNQEKALRDLTAARKAEFNELLESERTAKNSSVDKLLGDQADGRKKVADKNAAIDQAADFTKTTTSLRELAAVTGQAETRVTGLFTNLRGIIDPAGEARKTLDGLSGEIERFEHDIANVDGPVTKYRETLRAMEDTYASLASKSDLMQTFAKQQTAANALSESVAKYDAELAGLTERAASADKPSKELERDFNNIAAQSRNAVNALQQAKNKLAETGEKLREAGIDTNHLAQADQQLATMTTRLKGAMDGLTDAVAKNGTQAKKTGDEWSFFEKDGGRTTLSMMQRLRGEVLSLTAGYLGLFGAIQGVHSVIESSIQKQAIENQLGVAFGTDMKIIGDQYKYVHEQANRLGVRINEVGDSYAKLAIVSKEANMSQDQTRFIFERTTEALRVNHASTDQTQRFNQQLIETISMGKLQLQHLKAMQNEIGGAGELIAKGLVDIGYAGIHANTMMADLYGQMKKGAVDGRIAMYALAVALQEKYGQQLPEALKSTQSEQGRLFNAIFDFKQMISDAGFGKEYTAFLKQITDGMSGDRAKEFAQNISDGLTKILHVLELVIQNADLLGTALTTALMVKGSYAVMDLVATLPKLIPVIKGLTTTINTELLGSITKVQFLQGAFGLLNAAIIGWQIGTYLSENFEEARLAGIAFVDGMLNVFRELKYAVKLTGAEIEDLFKSSNNALTKGQKYQQDMAQWQNAEPRLTGSVLMDELHKDDRKKWQSAMPVKPSDADMDSKVSQDNKSHYDQVLAEKRKDAAKDKAIIDQMVDDEIKKSHPDKPTVAAPTTKGTTAAPGAPTPMLTGDPNAEKKRAAAIASIENELASMRATLDTAEKDSLTARIAAYRERYNALAEKIKKVGGSEGKSLQGQMDAILSEFTKNETAKYNKEVAEQQRALTNKMDSLDNQSAVKMVDIVKAKRQLIKDQYDQLFEQIDKYEKHLAGSHADGKLTADDAQQIAGYRENATNARNNAESKVGDDSYREALKRYREKMQQQVDIQSSDLNDVALEKKHSLISEPDAAAKNKQILEESDEVMKKMEDDMLANAKAAGATNDQLKAMKANLDEIRNKNQAVKKEAYSAADAYKDIESVGTSMFKGFANGLVNVNHGMSRWQSGIKGVETAFMQFAANFLMKIAEMILKQQILNALGGSSGGMSSAVSGAVSSLFHTGGVVGSGTGMSRGSDSSWFSNAPKYHTGGIAGLQADEYPAILKRGEEVLTADSQRNVLNGGASGKGVNVKMGDTKIINMIDHASVVSEGLSSTLGTRTLVNVIKANKSAIKTVLG